MRFRRDARLDPSQVEDYRGRGVEESPGGLPVTLGGGGGIIGMDRPARVHLPLRRWRPRRSGITPGPDGRPPPDRPESLSQDCKTGADANTREDCRILAVVNSVQVYWSRDGAELRAGERLRFFTDSIQTGCGAATSAVGPFYCPNDKYVYIDLGFFDQMTSQARSAGRSTSPRHASSPTSTATTSRISLGTLDKAGPRRG